MLPPKSELEALPAPVPAVAAPVPVPKRELPPKSDDVSVAPLVVPNKDVEGVVAPPKRPLEGVVAGVVVAPKLNVDDEGADAVVEKEENKLLVEAVPVVGAPKVEVPLVPKRFDPAAVGAVWVAPNKLVPGCMI